MGRAKDIQVKVIPAKVANEFIKRHHYSGKVVQNSALHFGAFLDGRLHGVMQYGSPLDKRKVLPLVHTAAGQPCLWNEMLELNRMAFDEHLPRNSESRCIAISFRLMRKNAPHIKWILSFSDGTQCGDGTIYRASGFVLTAIKESDRLIQFKDGLVSHAICLTLRGAPTIARKYNPSQKTEKKCFEEGLFEYLPGYQLRYIYLIDKTCKITVPILPFSKIDELGAGMYKGEKITLAERRKHAAKALTDDVTG